MRHWLGVLLFLGCFSFIIRPIFAEQQTISDDTVNAVAKGLYCPVCESEPLDTCQTEACHDWREEIRARLSEGETPQQIYDYFRSRYGEGVLARPTFSGINWLLWGSVPILLLVAGSWFARYLRAIQTPASATTVVESGAPPSPDPYWQRVEAELQERDKLIK